MSGLPDWCRTHSLLDFLYLMEEGQKGIEMNDNTNTKTEELVPTPSLNDLQRLDQAKAVYTQSQEQVGDETEVANP